MQEVFINLKKDITQKGKKIEFIRKLKEVNILTEYKQNSLGNFHLIYSKYLKYSK